MYATIQHSTRGTAATDELAQAGYALAARLTAAPGFVACLTLETADGGCASVCIFEDQASLAAAGEVVARWSPDEFLALSTGPAWQITGEVIAQKGL